MGRPFSTELDALETTYAWARTVDIHNLRQALQRASGPLLAVGSGGSFTGAAYACYLHENRHGEIARASTPLETVTQASHLRNFHALIVSAGGRNRDGLQACGALIRSEPHSITVLCGTKMSQLGGLVRGTHKSTVEELVLPVGKDGFLATNSLLAFCTVLCRAYKEDSDNELPESVAEFLNEKTLATYRATAKDRFRSILGREVILVLYGPSTRAAALDIESKFSEAALGSVQLADFRNFGHGRHHWLAKHPTKSAVLAIVHKSDEPLASQTLRILPTDVPQCRIDISGSTQTATLGALVAGFYLTGLTGGVCNIDPGRPGVPAFGSRLYSLRMPKPHQPSCVEIAAWRKARTSRAISEIELRRWRQHAEKALLHVRASRFVSLALDFDGTLCAPDKRHLDLPDEIAEELRHLVETGLLIGIATGRGKSVATVLRRVIPQDMWSKVLVGHYNGGYITSLDQDLPEAEKHISEELAQVLRMIEEDSSLQKLARIEPRRHQITIECIDPHYAEYTWDLLQLYLHRVNIPGIAAVRSSHSVDILGPGTSKLALVQTLERQRSGLVLRIGDQGRLPGNDYELLDAPLGLSVDEVSSSETTCWNFAPVGVRGVQATLHYLKSITGIEESYRLAIEEKQS